MTANSGNGQRRHVSESVLWPLAVFLMFVGVVTSAAYVFFERLKQSDKAVAASSLTSIGRLKAEQVRSYIQQEQNSALSIARLLGQGKVADWLGDLRSQMPASLRESLLAVMRNSGNRGLLILDGGANPQFSAGQYADLNAEGRAFALRAMTANAPVTSDIYRGEPAAPEQALLDIFVPIQDNGARTVGILVLRNDLAYLYGLIQTWPVESPTAESYLVRLEGDHALFLNELRFRKQTALRMQVPLSAGQEVPGWLSTAAARGQTGVWNAYDYRGHSVLGYTLPVPERPGWGLVVKVDLAEVFAPTERLRAVTIGITTAFNALALVTLGTWLLSSQRRRDSETAERQRTSEAREEEAIRALNASLEQRVRERTAALGESEARYRALFDSIDEGFCIIQMIFDEQQKPVDYRFLEVNPSFEQQTGLRDALGKSMREIAPRHEEHWFETYGRIAVTGEAARFQNRAEQLHRWYDVYAFRFGEPKNRQVGVLFSDITERKATEATISRLNADLQQRAAQLEAANKELESFSYSVSHDLRAPLRHIHGYGEMLQRATADGQPSDKAQHYVNTIMEASAEMGALIDDLLAFSRMGRVEMRECQVPLGELVEDSVRGLEMATRNRHIVWQIAPLPAAVGDPPMVKQVLANLIGNAVKYSRMRDPARIEIGCAGEENGRMVIFVRDNGAGFDQQYAHKLFGVFQRLHRAEEFEGTGIGLATVQRIVSRHGGRVWAEGALDQGATFYFTLLKPSLPA